MSEVIKELELALRIYLVSEGVDHETIDRLKGLIADLKKFGGPSPL